MASQSYYNQGQDSEERRDDNSQQYEGGTYDYGQQRYPPRPQYDNQRQSGYQGQGSYYQQSDYSNQSYQSGYQQPQYNSPPPGYSQYPSQPSNENSYGSNPPPQRYHENRNESGLYGQDYPSQPSYGQEQQPGPPEERGFLGAVAGGATGAYAGHKMHHGIIGGIGGAIAGSMIQDHFKKEKEEKKHEQQMHEQQLHQQQQYQHYGGASPRHHDNFAGNFSASSGQISLDRDCDLIASCGDIHGSRRMSSINLNDCLTNEFGVLRWARGGNFRASARNIRLVDGGRVLEAELGDGSGGWRHSSIYLDERISNQDGNLVFLD